MLATLLIVFRETLEAAMFVGIIAAATRPIAGRARWLTAGVAAGTLGALVLALLAQRLAAWQDGIGQDLANITILATALVMLLWHCVWVSTHSREMAADARRLGHDVSAGTRKPWALVVAAALAVLREGAETVLFVGAAVSAAAAEPGSALLGGALGVACGAAVGALLYFGLSRVPARSLFTATNVLIGLLAASLASQLAKALAQAGLVAHWTTPLWDSSAWLAPQSALGTLLHALIGYDAQPSGLQALAYVGVLLFIGFGSRFAAPPRAAAA